MDSILLSHSDFRSGFVGKVFALIATNKQTAIMTTQKQTTGKFKIRCRNNGILVTSHPEKYDVVWSRPWNPERNPTDRERDDLDETIWQMVHGWCDQQYHDIPDDSRRYLMDQIKSLVINTTSDEQSSQGTINN